MSLPPPGSTPAVITPVVRNALTILARIGAKPSEVRPINHATQLRFRSGALVNVFDTGSLVFQGPHRAVAPIRAAFEAGGPLISVKPQKVKKAPGTQEGPTLAVKAPIAAPARPASLAVGQDTPPW